MTCGNTSTTVTIRMICNTFRSGLEIPISPEIRAISLAPAGVAASMASRRAIPQNRCSSQLIQKQLTR